MSTSPTCPKCNSSFAYEDRSLWVCPECAHEWNESVQNSSEISADTSVKDAHGNVLQDGDSVVIVKDLKVKGSSSVIKVGTKIKNIRIIEGADDHNIGCKIEGFGSMNLKSEFVKKS